MSRYETKVVAVDRVNLWRVVSKRGDREYRKERARARLAHYQHLLGSLTVEQADVVRRTIA